MILNKQDTVSIPDMDKKGRFRKAPNTSLTYNVRNIYMWPSKMKWSFVINRIILQAVCACICEYTCM